MTAQAVSARPDAPALVEARLESVRDVGGRTFLLRLSLPGPAPQPAWPALGRFAKLRAWAPPPAVPLLDRPFSIHRSAPGQVEFLIRRLGPATAALTAARPGQAVRLTGPLGRGLEGTAELAAGRLHLAAGGAGLAPMASIMERLGAGARLFYGERTAEAQVDLAWLQSWAGEVEAAVEDGRGYGRRGLIVDRLDEALSHDPRPIFGCGPPGFLRALAVLARRRQTPLLVGAEAFMACGLGVCLSCSLPLTGGGRVRVCREGPALDGLTIDWEAGR
ncbi:MAG: hypothetical protein LBU12_08855 [Deltaproteobacteria bacterium]|nr:hypothetical protein [Deltaproteobacteria bacterium]